MVRSLVSLLLVLPICGEIVDRIAITVEHQVITELQIDEELRVTAFLNHSKISFDLDARRAAADRLVAQLLVDREMRMSRYPTPPAEAVEQYLSQVRQSFVTQSAYQESLHQYGITESSLREHLANQLATMSFIEVRFRPNLDVPDSDVQAYYQREMLTWKQDHPGLPPPTFEQARPEILKILTEEHTDQILDTWLEEARKQVNIIYLDKALQ